jgi:D-glycero-D-manno-heptose 1,7-bisphosphate phosphatase
VQPPEHEYVTRPEDFELLPGALDGIAELARCGFTLAVVSNQRGIARGLVDASVLDEIERRLQAALEPLGARIAGFYYCPHMDEDDCDCRKPKPGLLLDAAGDLGLDLEASWMIGDSLSDVQAGAAAGCRTAYLGPDPGIEATLSAPSLELAAPAICGAG